MQSSLLIQLILGDKMVEKIMKTEKPMIVTPQTENQHKFQLKPQTV